MPNTQIASLLTSIRKLNSDTGIHDAWVLLAGIVGTLGSGYVEKDLMRSLPLDILVEVSRHARAEMFADASTGSVVVSLAPGAEMTTFTASEVAQVTCMPLVPPHILFSN